MLRQLVLAAILTSCIGTSSRAQAPATSTEATGPDSVKVTVTGIRSAKGRIRIELWGWLPPPE